MPDEKPFDERSPEELEAMADELDARRERENLPPRIVEKFKRKLRAEAGRRRWRATLATERARRRGGG